MMMKTKVYIKPEIQVVETEAQPILAGSPTIEMATEEDYTDESMESLTDNQGGIWAD